MGLHVSHGTWEGAYSAFTRWRNRLAEVAGYWVCKIDYDNDGKCYDPEVPIIDWGHVTRDQLLGEWAETPDDPLIVLIAHADDDGVIHPEQAGPLADRLPD